MKIFYFKPLLFPIYIAWCFIALSNIHIFLVPCIVFAYVSVVIFKVLIDSSKNSLNVFMGSLTDEMDQCFNMLDNLAKSNFKVWSFNNFTFSQLRISVFWLALKKKKGVNSKFDLQKIFLALFHLRHRHEFWRKLMDSFYSAAQCDSLCSVSLKRWDSQQPGSRQTCWQNSWTTSHTADEVEWYGGF